MTPDEERAREIVKKGWNLSHNWMELPATANDLIREVAQALARERREENEACAKVADRDISLQGMWIAKNIRARQEPK